MIRRQPASASIVPAQSIAGRALGFVVAIMTLLGCLTLGAVTLVFDSARQWQSEISREMTIQIRPVEGLDLSAEIEKIQKAVATLPGIGSVQVLDDKSTAALLEPWLGGNIDINELPVPRLIVVSIADREKLSLNALRGLLKETSSHAWLDDHSTWTSRLRGMANTLIVAGLLILMLVLAAMALAIVFATRAAMAGNREVVDVLHFIGAEDRFIAGEFQRHFLLLGMKGGIAGGLIAAILFVALSFLAGSQGSGGDALNLMFGGFAMGITGYVGIVGLVFVVAVLTALTSRVAVQTYLG